MHNMHVVIYIYLECLSAASYSIILPRAPPYKTRRAPHTTFKNTCTIRHSFKINYIYAIYEAYSSWMNSAGHSFNSNCFQVLFVHDICALYIYGSIIGNMLLNVATPIRNKKASPYSIVIKLYIFIYTFAGYFINWTIKLYRQFIKSTFYFCAYLVLLQMW